LHKKTIDVPATTTEIIESVTCDFCGVKLSKRNYEFKEVILEYNKGCNYPEGGGGVRTVFDCCSECWESKIEPAFRKMGAIPRSEEWEI